ncbi:histidine kinase [Frankia sp. B2]|nr:histidine kinase [Frankia sp. B2]
MSARRRLATVGEMVEARRGIFPVIGDLLFTAFTAAALLRGSGEVGADQVPPSRPLDAFAYVLLALLAAAIPLRRRAPLAMLMATSLLLGGYLGTGYPHGPAFFPVIVSGLAVGLRHDQRTTSRAVGVCVLLIFLGSVVALLRGYADGGWKFGITMIGTVASCTVPAFVGALIRLNRIASAQAKEEATRRRIEQERLRMAREVHDVVGHSRSIISLQAAVALHVLDRRPEQAQVALEAIRRTSVDALDELRATLALTRAGRRADPAAAADSVTAAASAAATTSAAAASSTDTREGGPAGPARRLTSRPGPR